MTDFIFSDAAEAFINTWMKYDKAALRLSTEADVALMNGRVYYPPIFALKEETDAFVDAKVDLADELGISSVHLMRALHELRHDGVDQRKAVRLVIQYLDALSHDFV